MSHVSSDEPYMVDEEMYDTIILPKNRITWDI